MTNPGYLAKFTQSLAGYAMLGVGRRADARGRVLAQEDRGDQVLMTTTSCSPCWRPPWPSPSPSPCSAGRCSPARRPRTVQARDNLHPRHRRCPPTGRAAGAGPGCGAPAGRRADPRAAPWPGSTGWPARAGRPADWPVPKLVAAKLVLAAVAGGLGLLVVSRGARPAHVAAGRRR